MKLLCIGKSGQVAQALVERSARADVETHCLGRPDLDLLQTRTVARALETTHPDLVVNAAAYTNVDGAETNREAAFALNGEAAGALAALCAERDLPLIHLSTDYVFDGNGDRPWRETDPVRPLNVYGASKLAGEEAVRTHHKSHIILRTAWVYSPFGKNFVKTMLRLADENKAATVVDDQIGSPTSAIDIAGTVLHVAKTLIEHPASDLFGTYHFAASGFAAWADVAALIFETYETRLGCKIKLQRIPSSDYPTPAKRPLNSRLNTDKITETFGVRPPDWKASVRLTVGRLLDERAQTQ
nr:dTDP-4-dehydrorhamnose reductase [Hyphomonas sp. Mor2]